jgi:hypothetical protein
MKGLDGGPLICVGQEQVKIIGIHRGGITLDGKPVANIGRLVTKDMVEFLV